MASITYVVDDSNLDVQVFLNLVSAVWPGEYQVAKAQHALQNTMNITAWDGTALVGCVRMLTDGYFFSTISEILVHPSHQSRGIGSKLMELVFEQAPSSLSFGVQPSNEAFFAKMGYTKGLDSYQKKKKRN